MRGKRRDSAAKVEEDRREESLGDEALACRPSHVHPFFKLKRLARRGLLASIQTSSVDLVVVDSSYKRIHCGGWLIYASRDGNELCHDELEVSPQPAPRTSGYTAQSRAPASNLAGELIVGASAVDAKNRAPRQE
jgi:hypothetical protein